MESVIFINFKTYKQGTGEEALNLVRTIEKVATNSHVKIIPVLQASDLREARDITKLEVWVQSIDPVDYGAHTGFIIAEAVKEDGAVGTFLNHSEHKFDEFDDLKKAVDRAKEVDLKTLVFAADIKELKKIVKLDPTYAAYEPPDLVGSKTTSVSESKPEIIKEASEIAKSKGVPLIVGAGIKSEKDVKISLSLGAVGVAVASDVVKAGDPERELSELASGY